MLPRVIRALKSYSSAKTTNRREETRREAPKSGICQGFGGNFSEADEEKK